MSADTRLERSRLRRFDDRSEEAREWRKLYSRARWRKLRLAHLQANPLCVMCNARGITMLADTVDHVIPHKGDLILFFDPDNLQSLDKRCHDTFKAQQERGGYSSMCDENGYPIDRNHPNGPK